MTIRTSLPCAPVHRTHPDTLHVTTSQLLPYQSTLGTKRSQYDQIIRIHLSARACLIKEAILSADG